jgi:hypothetical protein
MINIGGPKGIKTVAINAASGTTTSSEINIGDNNAILIDVVISGSGTWKIDVQGELVSGGTFKDIYDNYDNQLTTGNITANRMRLFVAVPKFIKIVATEVVNGATCTVNVMPITI